MSRGMVQRILAIAFWLSFGPAGPAAAQRLVVTEVWATKGGPEALEFTAITGGAIAPDGRIWVTDGPGRILVLSPDGEVEMTVGRRGDGPGEFLSPTLIQASPWGEMVVFDLGRRSLDYFGPGGDFVRRILLTSTVYNPKGMVVLPDSSVVLSGGTTTAETAIHQFSSQGEEIRSWWPIEIPVGRTRDDFMNARYVAGGPISLSADGGLLFSVSAPHGIYRFSPGDTIPKLVASDPDLLVSVLNDFERTSTDEQGGRVIQPRWFFDQSRAVFSLNGGIIVNSVTFENRSVTLWEAYGPGGDLLSREETPREYWVWDANPNGMAIASFRDLRTGEHFACLLRISIQ